MIILPEHFCIWKAWVRKYKSLRLSHPLNTRGSGSFLYDPRNRLEEDGDNSYTPCAPDWPMYVNVISSVCSHRNHPSLPPCPLASLCSSVTRNQWKETWARCANNRANCRHHHHNSARNCAKISSEVFLFLLAMIQSKIHNEFLRDPRFQGGATIVGVADDLLIPWPGQMDWKYTGKCPECHTSWQKCDIVVTIVTWSAPINGRSEDMWTG